MDELSIAPGSEVMYLKRCYRIQTALDLDKVLLVDLAKGETVTAEINLLEPIIKLKSEANQELSTISDEDWKLAKKRELVLAPLVKKAICSDKQIQKASDSLGLKRRQIYYLLNNYRTSGCKLLSLLPKKTGGGAGKSRLNAEIEQIIDSVIKKIYLTSQRIKASILIEEVKRLCFNGNIKAPGASTIRRRLANCYTERQIIGKRNGFKAAKDKFSPIKGNFPETKFPLQIYQIDHTKVDLIIVDETYRQPIGRPYITVAIDVYSRCIPGFCLTLEPPSTTAVGLCLTHAVFDKAAWLAERKIEAEWPIWGKPECIYVDNAKEFHSSALARGCEAHGIKIEYRPIGKAHYGGIIERIIGTLMQLVHQLPGTTFSNVQDKGAYNSEKKAVLTLAELERWFTIAITQYYHNKIHTGLRQAPIEQYKTGILGDELQKGRGYPPRIYNQRSFLVDFLPIEYRTIQRHGFMLDNIKYYSNTLSPFLANKSRHGKFLIRRDPRNLSVIYVLDPKSQQYFEVPYRTLSRPSISLWEHREALKYLHNRGIKQKDENAIFLAIENMREIAKKARIKSKLARKQYERTIKVEQQVSVKKAQLELENFDNVKPYEVIEIW